MDVLNARMLGAALSAFALAACATTSTEYPRLDAQAVAAEVPRLQAGIVDAVLERKARVDGLAWPILAANADLCHDRRREAFGITIGNARTVRDLVDGLTSDQVRAIGYGDEPVVLGVSAGSPADLAGIRRGAVPVKVGDVEIAGDLKALSDALRTDRDARANAKENGETATPLPVIFEQDGERIEADLAPQTICDVQLRVVENNVVNASATDDTIRINRGLLANFPDDRDVSLVIAHELGHVAGRHVPKLERNAAVSGLYVWGVPVALGAGLVDLTLGGFLERFAGRETPPGSAMMTRIQNRVLGVQDFEREADYLSVYMAARTGIDISNVEQVFETFSTISPLSTYGERTHPTTPERMAALSLARDEVQAKQAAGEPLIPNGWPWPVPEPDEGE